jgi:hypothetical protein
MAQHKNVKTIRCEESSIEGGFMAEKVSIKLLVILVLSILLSGCGLKYTINDPTLSNLHYNNIEMPVTTLAVVDQRKDNDAVFMMGKLGLGATMSDVSHLIKLQNIDNPIAYLALNLEKELVQRGIPAKLLVAADGSDGPVLKVEKYQILNFRASGFSPWEACHIFSGILVSGERQTPIKAFFYNGKTPVWSMNELSEPCFNVPSSILIKDIASKINKALFKFSASDLAVEKLSAEIESEIPNNVPGGPFWKVLELGYSNNPKAAAILSRYASQGDAFFKSCVLSAIGILGIEEQLDFLKQQYNAGGYNARYMAVKAIGDIGTPEALKFIQEIKTADIYEKEGGLKSSVDLYAP